MRNCAFVLLVVAAGAAPTNEDDLAATLQAYGLDDLRSKLERRGVGSERDLGFLTDADIDALWWESVPPVQRQALRVARNDQVAARHRAKHARTAKERVASWLLATAETAIRGACLGSGASFLWETASSAGFFRLERADLETAIKAASLRASAVGCATALTCLGASMLVPHALRANWLGPLY